MQPTASVATENTPPPLHPTRPIAPPRSIGVSHLAAAVAASPPPSPPPQSTSLDLNKIALRFADEDEDEDAERRRRLLNARSCVSEYRLSALNGDDSIDYDEDDDAELRKGDGAENEQEAESYGEFCCFFGWITLHVTSKKKRVYWLTLRGNELSFHDDDAVSISVTTGAN